MLYYDLKFIIGRNRVIVVIYGDKYVLLNS